MNMPRPVPNKICATCSKEFYRTISHDKNSKSKLFFCSTNCKNIAQQIGGIIKPAHYGKYKNKNCIRCDAPIAQTKHPRKFCKGCQSEYQYENYIKEWLNGEKDGMLGPASISPYIRRWMFEKHNSKCEECGWARTNPSTGKIPLTIDHVDGNWKNNHPDNLKLLCPCCHALTPTFGSLNKGKGRPNRRVK
jgi:hypothetical protein